MTPDSDTDHAILAIHPGALGDVVLFGHLLAAVGGRVTLVAGGQKARLLAGMNVVHQALDFDSLPMHEVFTDTPADRCRLPRLLGSCERLLSFFPAGDRRAEARLAALCGATSAAFLPVRPPEHFAGHLLELWCDLLAVTLGEAPAAWAVPPQWRSEASEAIARCGGREGRPYVLIHPGAGSRQKCWPLERFVELAGAVEQAVFVLGPVECEQWGADQVEGLRGRFPAVLSPSLAVLAGLAAGAAGYVGNDSGASHLSAAVGTPTVALFGPSRVEHFAPRGRCVRTLAARNLADIAARDAFVALAEISGLDSP